MCFRNNKTFPGWNNAIVILLHKKGDKLSPRGSDGNVVVTSWLTILTEVFKDPSVSPGKCFDGTLRPWLLPSSSFLLPYTDLSQRCLKDIDSNSRKGTKNVSRTTDPLVNCQSYTTILQNLY